MLTRAPPHGGARKVPSCLHQRLNRPRSLQSARRIARAITGTAALKCESRDAVLVVAARLGSPRKALWSRPRVGETFPPRKQRASHRLRACHARAALLPCRLTPRQRLSKQERGSRLPVLDESSALQGPARPRARWRLAVSVRNRGSRPALDVRTCVRLPRPGSGPERRRDAAQRRVCWRIAWLAPRARRILPITAHVSCVRAAIGQHHRPWRQRAPPHRADPTPDRLRAGAPALHGLTTVAPARREVSEAQDVLEAFPHAVETSHHTQQPPTCAAHTGCVGDRRRCSCVVRSTRVR